ncbi:MAG: Flavin-dependent tryptophan halogenase RebH [Hyphomonas sp. TMED17]|nr:MAG: Flavin-dependent tryptophan halogenase RebH [Hyphomonas sp. TMED17]
MQDMCGAIKHIVIVGGGTAGWITAGVLAASHSDRSPAGLRISLIESPDIPTIGVGEGTWPTIRNSLARIGISEAEFLHTCNASFKQGSRFNRWVNGEAGDSYVHPFELPISSDGADALNAWKALAPDKPFAEAVCVQSAPGQEGLAPRQRTMPDYNGAMNYAYHLDAGKLVELLRNHAVSKLGVERITDNVVEIVGAQDSDIEAVRCEARGLIAGDLFIDCTGRQSLLLGGHYDVGFVDKSNILFNNRAVVTHVPVAADSTIASETVSTAHEAGWIWDIGLPTRRGVGCVYASDYMDDERAEATLRAYLGDAEHTPPRRISFKSGHREIFWHQNCVAVGLSAGFLEPLEASAIVLLELSAAMIADNMPVSRAAMSVEARKFNQLFLYRWGRIIDFLKLHYVLSQRDEPYWQDNRRAESIPERLQDYLEVWKTRPPNTYDFEQAREVFPVASYLFVTYGMGMTPATHPTLDARAANALKDDMQKMLKKRRKFTEALPTNRALLTGSGASLKLAI